MATTPFEIQLDIRPRQRVDVIDVSKSLADKVGDTLSRYRRALYCSHHTTAGYLEQSLCSRLENSRDRLNSFLALFGTMFPPDANYEHDKLHLRTELSDEQRSKEPRNADSHLAFIGSGLKNCTTYRNQPDQPVFFIDLDGVSEHGARQRHTTVIGFDEHDLEEHLTVEVPVSRHPIDAVNLREEGLGFFDQLQALVRKYEIAKGRIDIAVDPEDSHIGLTVNEYETLLMKHDLLEVLKDPVRFMAEKGRSMWRDPKAIPYKTRNYAQYDFVRFMNQAIETFGISESILERLLARVMAVPASRFLRMRRNISLLISDRRQEGRGEIIQGTYQSPILVQWRQAPHETRRLHLTLRRFS